MYNLGNIAIPTEDGTWVSEDTERIARILKDYDPDLELRWIPPARREPGDKPFCVIHHAPNGSHYVVGYFDKCDENLLATIFNSDSTKNDPIAFADAKNAAERAILMKKQLDEAEERQDFIATLVKSNKHSFKHAGIDWHRPFGGRIDR